MLQETTFNARLYIRATMLQIFEFGFENLQRNVTFNVAMYAMLHDIDLFSRRQNHAPKGWQIWFIFLWKILFG